MGTFFTVPRMCNHCTNPPCVAACEQQASKEGGAGAAMHKRESDGVVTIDAEGCNQCGLCVTACPYKIPMENLVTGGQEMCDFCISRVEKDYAPVCAKSCPALATYFGYLDDEASFVHKLVKKYKVALPLRPDFGTGANVYYVPPFVRPRRFGPGNEPLDTTDIPIELLHTYFGADADQALATLREHRAKATAGESSELMDLLIIYRFADAFAPLKVTAPE